MPQEYNYKHKTELNSKQIFDLYQKGDKDAIKCVAHFSHYLGRLIAEINRVLCINNSIIGRGLSHASEFFFDKVMH
jgi:predicted NBD/HSP70 family sugar kinase